MQTALQGGVVRRKADLTDEAIDADDRPSSAAASSRGGREIARPIRRQSAYRRDITGPSMKTLGAPMPHTHAALPALPDGECLASVQSRGHHRYPRLRAYECPKCAFIRITEFPTDDLKSLASNQARRGDRHEATARFRSLLHRSKNGMIWRRKEFPALSSHSASSII
jgi:hypothetical protein